MLITMWCLRGRDRMLVGFTTTCAISAYYHERCEFESRSWRGVLDTTMSVTCGRSVVFTGYSNKTYCYNITEVLLKVALYTITRILLRGYHILRK